MSRKTTAKSRVPLKKAILSEPGRRSRPTFSQPRTVCQAISLMVQRRRERRRYPYFECVRHPVLSAVMQRICSGPKSFFSRNARCGVCGWGPWHHVCVNLGGRMSAFITLRIRSRFVAITCLLLLSAAVPVFSQTSSAGLVGNVHDSSEAVVAGVTVTATQLETGLQRTAQTNSQGDYVLSNLPVGTYSVSASATGFAISTQKNIVLEVGKVLTVNVTLQVGQITQ